jgi:undecaprenyl diphosphate synthase
LWEIAYAEMIFLERMWPDFTAADLAEAIREFRRRDRRVGRVREAAVVTAKVQEGL